MTKWWSNVNAGGWPAFVMEPEEIGHTIPEFLTGNFREIAIPRWSRPRVHPNGPIQLDLDEEKRYRLHVWMKNPIAQQVVSTPIHDHAFDLESWVLYGLLRNITYGFHHTQTRPSYRLWEVVAMEGSETNLKPTDELGYLHEVTNDIIQAVEQYHIPPYVLHWAFPETDVVVTLISKKPRRPQAPSVAVPINEKPDNDFRRGDVEQNLLWPIIAEALKLAGIRWSIV